MLLFGLPFLRGLLSSVGLRDTYLSVEIGLTRATQLFDREHYLRQLSERGEPLPSLPLRHYVTKGAAQGLSPAPLFDPQHYLSAASGLRLRVNPLLHYALRGRFLKLSPSPFFDVGYYLASNPDVAASGRDPLHHFIRWGWREGRNPKAGFDMRTLMQQRTLLRVAKTNPLVHHLLHRRDEAFPQASPHAPSRDYRDPELWRGVSARAGAGSPTLDVIVPVYRGLQETLRCIHSVLSAPVALPFELVVINDASPEPALRDMLGQLAAQGLFTLHENARNLGFVKTVNRGMRLHPGRDVVILNADTEVFNDWLDRLVRHAQAQPAIATVTPLSNNATICSYPEWLQDNCTALEIDAAAIDRIAAASNALQHVETPTGVGFCMYVRRRCLEQIGLFNEARFGKGYGEENELCMRALKQGWINAIAGDVYVRHAGSTSFGSMEAALRTEKGLKVLARLHPDYPQRIRDFTEADPLHAIRARIDLARLKARRGARNVLIVTHDRGGGTERHVSEETAAFQARGLGVFELRPSKWPGQVALSAPGLPEMPNLARWSTSEDLLQALRELDISEIHIHHLVDFPSGGLPLMNELREGLAVPLHVVFHDYYWVCPRINLVDAGGRYCGEPDEAGCDACLAQEPAPPVPVSSIRLWRASHGALLRVAASVRAPDEDVTRRIQRRFPSLAVKVTPHQDVASPALRMRPPRVRQGGDPLRVLVIGAVGKIKGYDVLLGMAHAVRQHGLPLQLELLGYSMNDAELASAGVRLQGRYTDDEVVQRIERCDPDIVFISSIWPETYCYTLSAAMSSGRQVAVFDIGAQARRVKEGYPNHLVLPLSLADDPLGVCEALLRDAPDASSVTDRAASERLCA